MGKCDGTQTLESDGRTSLWISNGQKRFEDQFDLREWKAVSSRCGVAFA
jgi:hypothetical protein